MSMDVDLRMVTPARPLTDALLDILGRWEKIGYFRHDPIYAVGTGGQEIDFSEGWEERINALEGVGFSAHRVGPPISAQIRKLGPGTLQANFSMQSRLFGTLYAARTLPENFYAPLLQAALALNARYGVGGLEYELLPESEEEVEGQIWTDGWLGFVRCDSARAEDLRAKTGFTMNARPEGYWWMEKASFKEFFDP